MNVIFLTLDSQFSISQRGIYSDLLRQFISKGHSLHVVKIASKEEPEVIKTENATFLSVRMQSLSGEKRLIKKGIATLLIEKKFIRVIKKTLSDVNFDLILYATPPITFAKVIHYLKSQNPHSISYLLLKDIFPQNAVDLNLFSSRGLIHWFFRRKEISLYRLSDFIGCMSPANVDYLLSHNPYIKSEKVEIAPNSIEPINYSERMKDYVILNKYGLQIDKPILIYGGNLGLPQGVEFLIECLEKNKKRKDCYFLIIGDGAKYSILEDWFMKEKPQNIRVIKKLSKDEYDKVVQSSDIGLIFLDHRFTIPNYPSRLLSYLEYGIPIIAATDSNTDIGRVAEENGYGLWCESNNSEAFTECVNRMLKDLPGSKIMGLKGRKYLENNYSVEKTYNIITSHCV